MANTKKKKSDVEPAEAPLEERPAAADEDLEVEKTTPVERRPRPRKPWAVYSGGKVDDVHASKIIYENRKAKNSLSVLQMQRALTEAGFPQTLSDRGGYFGPGTLDALDAYRSSVDLPADTDLYDILVLLFKDDPNVALHR